MTTPATFTLGAPIPVGAVAKTFTVTFSLDYHGKFSEFRHDHFTMIREPDAGRPNFTASDTSPRRNSCSIPR